MAEDTFASAARWTKAWKLARWLRREGFRAQRVADWSDTQWELAAASAGVNAPSDRTKGMVVGLLAGGEPR